MATRPDPVPGRLTRVAYPVVRGTLVFEPVGPSPGPIEIRPATRVAHPLVRGVLRFEPVGPACPGPAADGRPAAVDPPGPAVAPAEPGAADTSPAG